MRKDLIRCRRSVKWVKEWLKARGGKRPVSIALPRRPQPHVQLLLFKGVV